MTADDDLIRATLSRSPLLSKLQPGNIEKVAGTVRLIRVKAGDLVVEAGQPSDAFYLVAEGEVSVLASTTSPYELCRLSSPESFGELGLLLETPRSATVRAAMDVALLVFDANVFKQLYSKVPDFGVAICSNLAQRLQQTSRLVEHPSFGSDGELPSAEVMNLLPVAFMMRHRVLPLHTEGQNVALGCVEEPPASVLQGVAQLIPGMEVGCVSIHSGLFDRAMKSLSGTQAPTSAAEGPTLAGTDALDHLLRRVVEEGASDLHLSAGHCPRWRIDGEMIELVDTGVLDGDAVFDMIRPKMREDSIAEFEATNDCDFAYAIEGLARFRVNIFRDRLGAGAVLRQIPDKILTLEQLGLPQAVTDLCNHTKGLILVTGPTGSGKSTTLAAIVDRINKERSAHILTLEDPIEFVHKSHKSLVNQREVGVHTESFARALKAALREDPDIIMVGEMRDLETVALALETANTGHLVFGTLHTSTAVGTVDRIVDLFPSEQQAQIRSGLAETLRGVVAQTLCKKIGGGRVAAIELLIGTFAVSNLIREGKTHQIPNMMVTGRAAGNQLLNYELKRLVDSNVVSKEEAMGKAVDKKELAKMLGVSV